MRNYCLGDTLDSVMNYPLREAILDFVTGKHDAPALVRLINHQAEVYPAPFRYALMNLIGSHDRARTLNVLCGRDGVGLSKKEQKELRLTEEEYALAVGTLQAVRGYSLRPARQSHHLLWGRGRPDRLPGPFCRPPLPLGQGRPRSSRTTWPAG